MPVVNSINNLNQENITELSAFFDLLAKFDFEDTKKCADISMQEVKTGSSLNEGEPILGSCVEQDKTS